MKDKIDRIDLYLGYNVKDVHSNLPDENVMITKFLDLYNISKAARDQHEQCSPKNLEKWRKSYLGTLNALTRDGEVSSRKSRSLQKIVYENIESSIDNGIPYPKIEARHKLEIPLVHTTERCLKFEIDGSYRKQDNDRNERATRIDGTTWFKVDWNPFDRKFDRNGALRVVGLTTDQVIPQPGVIDYKKMEYIFEERDVSITDIYDLYGVQLIPTRNITAQNTASSKLTTNLVTVISCYYLDHNRNLCHFMWQKDTNIVVCDEKDYDARKVRKCQVCGYINPIEDKCSQCGSTNIKYEIAEEEILDEDYYQIHNVYNPEMNVNEEKPVLIASAGDKLPFYRIRQLPFVPRVCVSSIDSIYGIGQAQLLLDLQDMANKVMTKMANKVLKNKTYITKLKSTKLSDVNDENEIETLSVNNLEEARAMAGITIAADVNSDIALNQILYQNSKNTSGLTDSFQGRKDTTATSGKAKEVAVQQSAGRIESIRIMKDVAMAGVYELMFKYLLAYCDDKRTFVRSMPDGEEVEESWSPKNFITKGPDGKLHYRDDFHFDTDPSSALSEDRRSMWMDLQSKFVMGEFGTATDPNTLEMYWNLLALNSYPDSDTILAGLKNNRKKIPYQIEKLLMENPQLMQLVVQLGEESNNKSGSGGGNGSGSGGARAGSGQIGLGRTSKANSTVQNTKASIEKEVNNGNK